MNTTPGKSLDDVLGYHLRRAQEAAFKAFARRVGDTAIWPGWYTLLTIIGDCPNINQTALSLASDRDKSTLTTSLRELVKAGLIERRRNAHDGRSYDLSLTAQGRRHLDILAAHARAHDALLDDIVGTDKRTIVIAALKAISERLNDA